MPSLDVANKPQELVRVFTGVLQGATTQLCDARELHAFLGVGRDFSTWIKGRIEQYEFEEGADYKKLGSPSRVNQKGRGGNRKEAFDYHLTVGIGKELSMLENTPQGRLSRRYFVECEKRLMVQTAAADTKAANTQSTINPAQKLAIREAVRARASRAGETFSFIYRRLYLQFSIPSYGDLPLEQFDNAMRYLQGAVLSEGTSLAANFQAQEPTDLVLTGGGAEIRWGDVPRLILNKNTAIKGSLLAAIAGACSERLILGFRASANAKMVAGANAKRYGAVKQLGGLS